MRLTPKAAVPRLYSMTSPLLLLIAKSALALALLLQPYAHAQAPVEERNHRADPLEDAQQRAEFARRQHEQADAAVKQAERALNEAEIALKPVQKQFDDARSRRDQARRQVAEAHAKSAQAKKGYEGEAAEVERLRRPAPQAAAKK